ncbi:MAG TPA: CRTAC1 family protein, partial [Vicinamibacteria bacterium]
MGHPRHRPLVALIAALGSGPAGAGAIHLEELAGRAGLGGFRHVGGTTPDKRYIPEVMSGGTCAFDADGDGWTDVFLVNGGTFAALRGEVPPPPHALYRNRGDGTFEDWTARSGLRNSGWGMGCVAADYDGDGRSDLYVTSFQSGNRLYRNRGGGVFEDATAASGTAAPPRHWSTGATFGDYDGDGDLDLFVAGYVALDRDHLPEPGANRYCRHHGLAVNCGPRGLPGEADLLFRNEGGGRFSDVSVAAGAGDPEKLYGLGALFLPLAAGERPSLLVANDSTPNALFRPRPGARFEDEGLTSGIALSEEGNEQACMGIAWGDYDGDGALDFYLTNFVDDYNTLYRGRGPAAFEDVTRRAQLAQPTWLLMGWGTAFADLDRDGRPDLVVANGHVYPQVDELKVVSRYRMPVQVFRNAGDGTFVEQPGAAPGEAVGRGLALGDFWNEGRLGFVVNNLDGAPFLFRNRTEGGGFVSLRLQGAGANREAVGARVTARWSGGRALAVAAAGGSYLSSHDPRLHLGVGEAAAVDLEVEWPSGTRQQVAKVQTGRFYRWAEGAA